LTLITPDAVLVTFRVTLAVCVRLPLVPVTVNVELPAGVELLVCIVNVELPAPLTEVGANEAVAPLASPLALRLTPPLNPFTAATSTV